MNISIYIKQPLLGEVRKKAQGEGISLSKLIEMALERIVNEPVPSIPLKTLSRLSGMVKLGGDAVKDVERCYE